MPQTSMARLVVSKDRVKPIRNRHPWIFSGAIKRVEGKPQPGDIVQVTNPAGDYLASAYFNGHSQIRGRIVSWDAEQTIDDAFWRAGIERAIALRDQLQLSKTTNAMRLVNAESDGLPGLVVDRYGDYLVMQCLTLGIDVRKEAIAAILADLLKPTAIIERSDAPVRNKEELPQVTGVLFGEAPEGPIMIEENGIKFAVDLMKGQKTGHYLDQRHNRQLAMAPRFVAGRDVLNAFSYTGGFGIYAAVNGAKTVTHIDSSAESLERAADNLRHNGIEPDAEQFVSADAFTQLRAYRDSGQQFDVIVLDPPKFASKRRDVDRACRGYKDLNWLAMRMLRPGGILATFSCSGLVSADLFQKVIFGAAVDAGRDVQIIQPMTQSGDHPVALTFPEGAYLKGLLCRVVK